ncbi:MAG: heat-inducible transcription repressor HrcA [Deltaproteobacteria bacterium]|nr:heat-inducible transcription repressor HrcA [Deltaproteobacteria bacterium]
MEVLSERNSAILHAIILDYVKTAEPVSSGAVSARFNGTLCPATIRNIMAYLEDMGYLKQPHKSAGRIPTASAFMRYIASIMKAKSLPLHEKKMINDIYRTTGNMESIMKETSLLLSALSTCMGIVLAPRFDSIKIHHLEFIKINIRQIMVILVSDAGIVQTKIMQIDNKISQQELVQMSEYLNNITAGRTLRELREVVLSEMRREKRLYDKLMKKVLMINDTVVKGDCDADIYMDGRINILNQPEFVKDVERIKEIFKAFEKKGIVVRFLDRAIESNCMQIFIGSDNEYKEINGLGLVTAPYGNDNCRCTVGIAGPIRMDYSRIIPIVDYTAKLLSKTMKDREGNQ